LKDFYWIHNPKPQAKAHLEAIVEGNTIIISGHGVEQVDLRLDSQLLDVNKPVTIRVRGMKDRIVKAVASLETYCSELEDLGDPDLATASVVKGIRLSP